MHYRQTRAFIICWYYTHTAVFCWMFQWIVWVRLVKTRRSGATLGAIVSQQSSTLSRLLLFILTTWTKEDSLLTSVAKSQRFSLHLKFDSPFLNCLWVNRMWAFAGEISLVSCSIFTLMDSLASRGACWL